MVTYGIGGMSWAEAWDIESGSGAEAVANSLIVGLIFNLIDLMYSVDQRVHDISLIWAITFVYLRKQMVMLRFGRGSGDYPKSTGRTSGSKLPSIHLIS